MAIDPIMLALCRGGGGTGFLHVDISGTDILSDNIVLDQDIIKKLDAAASMMMPVLVTFSMWGAVMTMLSAFGKDSKEVKFIVTLTADATFYFQKVDNTWVLGYQTAE